MENKKLNLNTRIIIFVTSFLVIADILLGGVMIYFSSRSTKDVLNHKMLELAQTAAALVNGDEIKGLTKEDQQNQTPAYTNNYNILSAFKTTSVENGADLAYIYCLVSDPSDPSNPDKLVFSIDPSDEPGEFLVEEPVYTPAMIAAAKGVVGIDDTPYEDRWGWLYSAYAPIWTSGPQKEVAGVIGVDVWARWYNDQVAFNITTISIVGVVTITAGVLISLLITMGIRKKFNDLSNDVASLEGDVQTLLQEIHKPEDFEPAEEQETPTKKGRDEMAYLKGRIRTAQEEIRQYISYAQQKAYRDPLTHIPNRLAYFERVKSINARLQEQNCPSFIVLVYDVNGLKDINDTYGHEIGDVALVRAAEIIQEAYGQANVFRIGGDEIVVILENVYLPDADELNRSFILKLGEYNKKGGELPTDLSLSRGQASFNPDTDHEFLDVFRRADKSMYDNKAIYHHANKKAD